MQLKPFPILLGVNVDHVATIRQARLTRYPSPLLAVFAAEAGGCDKITVHLREDRRHIQEKDVILIKENLLTQLNLEMAVTDKMLLFAEKIRPPYCCLVPEKREELTTEGGLDVLTHLEAIKKACARLQAIECEVSLFIDPDIDQIKAALKAKASAIEIHTGTYALASNKKAQEVELKKIRAAAKFASEAGLIVNAGHGLHYQNVQAIAAIPYLSELNIGHSIIAESLFIGLTKAVKKMKQLMLDARNNDNY